MFDKHHEKRVNGDIIIKAGVINPMNCADLRAIKRAPCSQEVMSSLRSVPQGGIYGKCFHPAICITTTNGSCDKDGIEDVCWLIVFALKMHYCVRKDGLPEG